MWAGDVAREFRPGKESHSSFSRSTSNPRAEHAPGQTVYPGNVSPATSRPGYPGFVAGEYGKCCSDMFVRTTMISIDGKIETSMKIYYLEAAENNAENNIGKSCACKLSFAIIGVIKLFEQAMETKEELRKQYVERKDISLERCVLIGKFLDDEA
ncbi:hypothetical protein Tco_1032696 [Tanacetum coccineum]|uniref:Uncharacterized protein n=1 Tax=Tanacetum coccineum TaxID=301880 RepID=A0ABQ5GE07_9ASTR